ncbi:Rrf2 family transcriptional regulator [Lacisediminimonas sp.]|uniref:RrF2 family transcriptional regulator n=1 Tax=Lacisediminimonas sp. TaxID=3060582 RepID=UPI0027218899|nr:Rrf2 family transcriptional regulator [Lacisediminimonas sp.]MDO8300532.1 Rrf2 family transcriptional regulator [Lacisediminimonas sp.]
MRLTDYTDYALRTLMYLGLHREQLVTIREISDAYGISNNHLTKVVHQLGLSGMVQTMRGRGGGLRLAMEPGDINLGAVVRLTEPDFNMVECFDPVRNDCVLAPTCQLKDVLRQATQAWLAVLDGVTLDQILSDPKGLRHSVALPVLRLMPAGNKKA